jgi:hypothetical protein
MQPGSLSSATTNRAQNLCRRAAVGLATTILAFGRIRMTRPLLSAAIGALLLGGLAAAPAHAAGCIKGAIIGGATGHFLGHHGLIGASAGCLIGHHEAAVHAREHARVRGQQMRYEGSTGGYDHAQSDYGR